MDTWYDDPLILFNETGDGIMRRDGWEGQLPEMPWKHQPLHTWEYSTLRFGGGTDYTIRCKKCGESVSKVYWDEDTEPHRWPEPPATYCDPTLSNEGYSFEQGG